MVLNGLDGQGLGGVFGIKCEEFRDRQIRHREWIMGEIDSFLVFVPLVHREVDDPAEFETILGDEVQLFADLHSRGSGKFDEVFWPASDKKNCVADTKLELAGNLPRAFRPDVLGYRTGAAFLALAPKDIGKDLETGSTKCFADILHDDRVAQVGLVAAV